MDQCDLRTLDHLKQMPNIAVSETTGYGHFVFAMNVGVPPFDNPDFRQAVKLSVDRDAILQTVFIGHGVVGNDNPISPSVKFAINPLPQNSYDPQRARALLKKAGLDGVEVELSAANAAFPGAIDAALLWQQHARKAGLNLKVVREPDDSYWDNVWLKKPFVASSWGGRPTCDWMFSAGYAADAAWNETAWKNPRFNQLLCAARSETEETRRAAMYAEMQQLVHDDGGLVNLLFNSNVDAHAKSLTHGRLASNWPMDGAKIAERWWFTPVG
jgi:peptide/nickel transport system substrate-binding protein